MIAQRSKELAALAEDLALLPGTHMVMRTIWTSAQRVPRLSSGFMGTACM